MNLIFSSHAWEDYLYWQQTDKSTVKRVHALIKAIQQTPFEGIGKPEPLKYGLAGYWSRRINDEHRIVHKIANGDLFIVQVRFHY